MNPLILVGAGGAVGSALRYLLGQMLSAQTVRFGFPVGTAAINISGCLLIGIVGAVVSRSATFPESMRVLLVPGLLGGFTTYSAFAYETVELLQRGAFFQAITYFFLTTTFGLIAVYAGFHLAH